MSGFHREKMILFVLLILILPDFVRAEKQPVSLKKLDGYLHFAVTHPNTASSSIQADGNLRFPVLIEALQPRQLQTSGIRIQSIAGSVATASVTCSELHRIVEDPNVLRIVFSGNSQMMLDMSVPSIGADRVHSGEIGSPYQGRDVIVGIVDSGIDWEHQDFMNPEGNSRLLFLWDMTQFGSPPEGYDYGSEYTADQINANIHGSSEGATQPSRDSWGHGSHVAGIAAGNGIATGNGKSSGVYVGVAPQADLIVVKGSESGLISDAQVIDGIAYIFQKAEILGKPAVVNISIGSQRGPHDGSSSYERGVDALLGPPGRAIVVAAGNDGDQPIHALVRFQTEADSENVVFRIPENPSSSLDRIRIEAWYSSESELTLRLNTPDGEIFNVIPGEILDKSGYFGNIYVHHPAYANAENGDKRFLIHISDTPEAEFRAGAWTLNCAGGKGRMDLWISEKTVAAEFESFLDYSTLIAEPGNARQVVTVGSYVSRMEWPSLWADPWGTASAEIGALSSFSSPGPTRPNAADNNPAGKPDITAPGETILSSSASSVNTPPSSHYIATDGKHRAWAGTSMSAPHVTGLIALLFEANPSLTATDITGILLQSADHDDFTGQGWNASWGYGKLNAAEALRLTPVKRETGHATPDQFLLSAFPNPFNALVTFECLFPESSGQTRKLKVYDSTGRLLTCQDLTENTGTRTLLRWPVNHQNQFQLASGVLIVVLENGSFRVQTKVLYLK